MNEDMSNTTTVEFNCEGEYLGDVEMNSVPRKGEIVELDLGVKYKVVRVVYLLLKNKVQVYCNCT